MKKIPRTVRLSDTDAAGVVYFANALVMCHEAYEESLLNAGINFQELVKSSTTVLPIVHSSVDFFLPMFCGDRLLIQLTPQLLKESEFEVAYQIFPTEAEKPAVKAITRHVCINPSSRRRTPLPEKIQQWLYG
ncbi:MAG: thioesterase family protein [Spirulinaceae cyanobacterium]